MKQTAVILFIACCVTHLYGCRAVKQKKQTDTTVTETLDIREGITTDTHTNYYDFIKTEDSISASKRESRNQSGIDITLHNDSGATESDIVITKVADGWKVASKKQQVKHINIQDASTTSETNASQISTSQQQSAYSKDSAAAATKESTAEKESIIKEDNSSTKRNGYASLFFWIAGLAAAILILYKKFIAKT